jgi:deoxyribodipyrimidine photo-lyase
MVKKERIKLLRGGQEGLGPVVYWMSRDQRISDNWALLYAQEIAFRMDVSLAVVFCLVPDFLNATMRQYGFMIEGLKEVEKGLSMLNIPFFLLQGEPEKEIPAFVTKWGVSALITDFDPLRIKRQWKEALARVLKIPFYEVDAHNIVPCWVASPKQEYGAYTIRPKINRLISEYLEDFPKVKKHSVSWISKQEQVNWDEIEKSLLADRSVNVVGWRKPGEKAARSVL